MTISIVDYGVGNLNSVRNMLQKVGVASTITRDPRELSTASTIILPGVGAFGAGMTALKERGLATAIKEAAGAGIDIVGICLGMQLLGSSSEEAECDGLDLIGARFRRFDTRNMGSQLPIPHMGWNFVQQKKDKDFLRNLPKPSRFYFVHSYFADEVADEDVLLTATYGHDFVAAYQRENVMGFQFHPEKSHKYGISLFAELFAKYRRERARTGAA